MYNDVLYKGRFIWNRLKNVLNQKSHRISFENAVEVFEDPFYVEEYDEANSAYEDRYSITVYLKDWHYIYSIRHENIISEALQEITWQMIRGCCGGVAPATKLHGEVTASTAWEISGTMTPHLAYANPLTGTTHMRDEDGAD